MSQSAALERVVDALDRLEGGHLGTTGDWLADGLRRYLAGEGRLDELLEVTRPDRAEFADAVRMSALRRAARCVDGSTRWQRAVSLAHEIRRFETAAWPRVREKNSLTDGSALRLALFEARRLGPLPSSPRHLYRLLGH